jgi:hypothetical protein
MAAMQQMACGCVRWISMFPERRAELLQLRAVPVLAKLMLSKSAETQAHARAVLLNLGEELTALEALEDPASKVRGSG